MSRGWWMLWLLLAAVGPAAAPAGAAATRSADLERLRRFEEANALFAGAASPEQALAAAALYQEILDGEAGEPFVSGAVLFNQGNAYAAAGELGRALRCYRLAARQRPRDPLLANNLGYVLGRLDAPSERPGLVDHLLFWRRWLTAGESAWIVAALATLAFALGAVGRRGRAPAAAALGAALLLGGALVFHQIDQARERGVVVVDAAVVRLGNSEGFAPAFNEPLREGAEFLVRERRAGWVRIEIPGLGEDLEGWLAAEQAVFY